MSWDSMMGSRPSQMTRLPLTMMVSVIFVTRSALLMLPASLNSDQAAAPRSNMLRANW
ncbi:hypothetical protein D3C72_2205620 [compost metagenome]